MIEETPVLLSKRKNIQVLLDYCLDQRIGFTVSPRAISNDDFEVEVNISGIKQAIALGMFVKENKFEVAGMGDLLKPKAAPTKKVETKESHTTTTPAEPTNNGSAAKEDGSLLSFDLNVSGN